MSAPFDKGSDLAEKYASVIKGKVILVTGVSPNSLGGQFINTIAEHQPSLLILAGRSQGRLEEASSKLPSNVSSRILILDLASQDKVREAAKEVLSYSESIDVLVNNAGIMAVPYSKTVDRIESQFACNHIGHFLFTNLILTKLSRSARIINVASDGYRLGPVRFEDVNFQEGKVYDKWKAYGQSKTANLLFTLQLSQRLHNITTLSVHPGVIMSGLGAHLGEDDFKGLTEMDTSNGHMNFTSGFKFKNMDEGVATHVYASFDPDIVRHSGAYLEDCHVMKPEDMYCWGRDQVDAQKLWKLSEELVGQEF